MLSRCFTVALVTLLASSGLADDRSFDGTENNLEQTEWGAAGEPFARLAPAAYPDGIGESITLAPNPRQVSNLLSHQVGSIPNARQLTSMVWQWGQFLDHDMTLSVANSDYGSAPIITSESDPIGMMMIPFDRTAYAPQTGGDSGLAREQINSVTSYIDASHIYGSNADRAAALRAFEGGRLKTSGPLSNLLPTDAQDDILSQQPNDDGGLGATPLFVAGDIRANEQPGLTALHTIFLREHNRLAESIGLLFEGDPEWGDERIYQAARKIVGAEIQAITYAEFLPALMGTAAPSAVSPEGYRPSVDATVSNEFATAFFRFGHSMLNRHLLMSDNNESHSDAIALRDIFFRPNIIMDAPNPDVVLDELLLGLTKQIAQEVDEKIVDDVRTFLFAPDGSTGLDLAAINIQRGRDHGIPNYNTMREALGLSPAAEFAELPTDVATQEVLRSLYSDVGELEAWVGALIEDHMPGTSLGPMFLESMIDQFGRLRDGDRFFYTHDEELQRPEFRELFDVKEVSLSRIILRNSGLETLPSNVFVVPEPSAKWMIIAIAFLLRRRSLVSSR